MTEKFTLGKKIYIDFQGNPVPEPTPEPVDPNWADIVIKSVDRELGIVYIDSKPKKDVT